jgi:hypothetical protein
LATGKEPETLGHIDTRRSEVCAPIVT